MVDAEVQDRLLCAMAFMVPFLPLAGFVVLFFFGDAIKREKNSRGGALLACFTAFLSFAAAVFCVVRFTSLALGRQPDDHLMRLSLPWLFEEAHFILVQDVRVTLSLLLDPLSAVMILVVTGIGFLIHLYSLGYMSHDEEEVRYFSYLNLFLFFMLVLVLGGNLPLLFVGWEGVGLCSYLLIGFWFKKKSASDAGKKAFIVNRIGDAGLVLGTILAFHTFGTMDLADMPYFMGQREGAVGAGTLTAIALLLFVGACGKSAQIPLHVWLPDAMEGPTPVSALIHAATMVTAGVYMVARLAPLYVQSDVAMNVVAVVGTATALVAATIALVQTDIKKVLAYSTVSQLGYMFLACGVGAFGVAVFHLFTHAFFKALLFLGSGSVIHALSGEQDLRKMGGLRTKIPWTFWTFAVGTAAIAGLPFLAGFYSKDAILAAAWEGHRPGLFAVGLFTAFLTAFYMSRLFFLTFFGTYRGSLEDASHAGPHPPTDESHGGHGHAHGIHESPWTMLVPLLVLAAGSIAAGYVHIPEIVAPALRVSGGHGEHPGWLPVVAVAVAGLGIVLAYYLYVQFTDVPRRIAARAGALLRVLEAKYGFDAAYDAFATRVVEGGSARVLWKAVDQGVIDGAVNGAAALAYRGAVRTRQVQTGRIRSYTLLILGGAVALLGYFLWS